MLLIMFQVGLQQVFFAYSIEMERKIIKNNEISQKPFLMILLKIFSSIQEELKKLPAFKCDFLEVKGINEGCLHKNTAQRLLKKEHEVKLFRETYEEISMMNKRKRRARRSDVVMKFSMVSDILLARMREQLSIRGEAKQAMLDCLLNLKDSFMDWGQRHFAAPRNWAEELQSVSKVTEDYKLKYVFSELATTNVTGLNSRSVSKHHNLTNLQAEPQEVPSNAEETSFKVNQKGRRERHTVNYLHDRSERRSTKKYTKNALNTDFDKKLQPAKTLSQESIECKGEGEEGEGEVRKQQAKRTNFQSEQGYLLAKNIQRDSHGQSSESASQSMVLASEEQENKKSAYFQSQNYIKSRKNLENMTLFVNGNKSKTKKRISNYLSSTSEVGFSENAFQDVNFLEPTEGYRSRKFLTRKYIPDDPKTVLTAKSEKALPRRRPTAFKAPPATTPSHCDKKPISKFHKDAADEIEEIRLERPQNVKRKFTSIKEDNAEEAVQARGAAAEGRNVGEFYAQLGALRSQLKRETDPFCHLRSQFFHQQGILWEEEKRRMQRVLEERNKQLYFREFEMACTTSNRDEDDALRAIRTDLVNLTHKLTHKQLRRGRLDQADLGKERELI